MLSVSSLFCFFVLMFFHYQLTAKVLMSWAMKLSLRDKIEDHIARGVSTYCCLNLDFHLRLMCWMFVFNLWQYFGDCRDWTVGSGWQRQSMCSWPLKVTFTLAVATLCFLDGNTLLSCAQCLPTLRPLNWWTALVLSGHNAEYQYKNLLPVKRGCFSVSQTRWF